MSNPYLESFWIAGDQGGDYVIRTSWSDDWHTATSIPKQASLDFVADQLQGLAERLKTKEWTVVQGGKE